VQFDRLSKREDVLGLVVAGEGLADRFGRRLAPHIPVRREHIEIALAVDDGTQDPHARDARDVAHDVVQLQIHLHQRLLHMLHVRSGVLEESFAMP
jgi:hypothetical protein